MKRIEKASAKLARGLAGSLLAGWIILLTGGGIDAFACDFDKIHGVWIAPSDVRIALGFKKVVAAVVSCKASSDEQGRVEFTMLLVDDDFNFGGEDSMDDILVDRVISGMVSAADAEVPIAAASVFTLKCNDSTSASIVGRTALGRITFSEEGNKCDEPADLGLKIEIERGPRTSPAVFPPGGPVPACCAEALFRKDAILRTVLVRVFPIFVPPEQVASVDDLPFDVTFVVKEGRAHLTFIEQAKGSFPGKVSVTVGGQSNSSSLRSPRPINQNGSLPISVTGSGPFVTVEGTVAADGTIDAKGEGTVAGFPDISVTLTGTLQGGALDSEYSMGTDGGLPGGFPIVFDLDGASPDFDAFWEGAAQAIEDVAQQLAVFNSPLPIGGVDFEDSLLRLVGNLLVAQAGLRFSQTPDPTVAALGGIEVRLNEFGDAIGGSTLPSRVGVEGEAREAAALFGEAATLREQMNALLQGPPSPALNDNLAAWLETLSQAVDALNAMGSAAFGTTFTTVSAASFEGPAVTAAGIVSGFGEDLGAEIEIATTVPLPTTLSSTSIRVTDSQGAERSAGLFFSSNTQFNFLIPADTALGPAILTVFSGDRVIATGIVIVQDVAPSLFTANATGEGVAAALFLRVAADRTRTEDFIFDPNTRTAVPIDLSPEGDQVFLLLFGTGIRGFTSEVTATVGGIEVPVLGAVAHGEFEGLDQVNIGPVPRSLIAAGEVEIVLIVDGIATKAVTVRFL